MTNATTSTVSFFADEYAGAMLGVPGRYYPRHALDAQGSTFSSQTWWSEARPISGYDTGATLRVHVRFDDSCRNGHNTFAITAEVRRPRARDVDACGCLHEDIAAIFPELAPLIRWHLTSADGPMHYVANTIYLAGDRDHSGRRAGEPSSVVEVIQFGDVPLRTRLEKGLGAFLRGIADYEPAGKAAALVSVAVAYKPTAGGRDYAFAPKYTFAGMPKHEWHLCPFDTEEEATRFAASVLDHNPRIFGMATAWSEGKERELDAARRAAIWPEATDAQLSVEREELRAALEARHPALMAAFRADMDAAGLAWSPAAYAAQPEAN